MKKIGSIIVEAGALPERHEMDTVNYLAALGHDIKFLVPNCAKGVRTPDIEMDGCRWELKCPCGNSKRTIENNYRSAQGQSENIIFNIRWMPITEKECIKLIKRQFELRPYKVKRILIITKDKKILDFRR